MLTSGVFPIAELLTNHQHEWWKCETEQPSNAEANSLR